MTKSFGKQFEENLNKANSIIEDVKKIITDYKLDMKLYK